MNKGAAAPVIQIEGMKNAILVLGLWLAGAPTFVASACCVPERPEPTSCGGCGEAESKQACCVTTIAPADTLAELPSGPDPVLQVAEEAPVLTIVLFAVPHRIESRVLTSDLPLYLRHRTLLI